MADNIDAEPRSGGSDQHEPTISFSADSAKEEDDLSGDQFDARFQLHERIGEGAASIVYRAEHKLLHETVAIKVLRKHHLLNPDAIERFKREVRMAKALNHRNIIKLKGFGISNEDEPFIVMQFCDGSTLEQKLKGRALPQSEVLELGKQLAAALSYAHAQGIIHRDIKPANILVANESTPGGSSFTAKLLDFGLAKEAPEGALVEAGQLTQEATNLGTPNYMSPEQCLNQPVDARTDIYSLGCVIYECATGRKPFQADSDLAVMKMHLHNEIAFQPGDRINVELKQLLRKSMQKDKTQRFQTSEELLTALANCPSTAGGGNRLNGSVALIACFVALLIPGAAGFIVTRQHHQPHVSKHKYRLEQMAAVERAKSHSHIKRLANIEDYQEPEEIIHAANIAQNGGPGMTPDLPKSESLYKKAREVAQKRNEPMLAAKCLLELTRFYIDTDEFRKAEECAKQALEESKKTSYKSGIVDAYRCLGIATFRQGENAEALEWRRKADALMPKDEDGRFVVKRELADGLISCGKALEAKNLMTKCRSEFARLKKSDSDRFLKDRIANEAVILRAQYALGELKDPLSAVKALIQEATPNKDAIIGRPMTLLARDLLQKHQIAAAKFLIDHMLSLPKFSRKERERIESMQEKCNAAAQQ